MNEGQGYHANMKEDDHTKSGLMCFLDQTRECGPDCMSFLTDRPEGPDYQGNQWSHCHVLVNMHRGGKHLVVLASIGSEMQKKAKNEQADRARLNQPPPPVPK